ncbi:hypothetical protein PAAG_11603 [Paracoccidioides lutzii Pb01]|uniref:Uncharacterized protein n=1 Tax=Paracoccidioides lutzii (strain ATCC MYA-826 / Pb01) TaxID=502779 RepID=A0A0A2V1F5_PARBA|nr:hypothetical protein PAAG_11603 [Paracoccidioides lutzii Pb01]KGQ01621.1 hypothetical protein PAAG_11603 [Paracoccidioides lutzii Pb01]
MQDQLFLTPAAITRRSPCPPALCPDLNRYAMTKRKPSDFRADFGGLSSLQEIQQRRERERKASGTSISTAWRPQPRLPLARHQTSGSLDTSSPVN